MTSTAVSLEYLPDLATATHLAAAGAPSISRVHRDDLPTLIDPFSAKQGTHAFHGIVVGAESDDHGFASLIATHHKLGHDRGIPGGISVLTHGFSKDQERHAVEMKGPENLIDYKINFGKYGAVDGREGRQSCAVNLGTDNYCLAALAHAWVVMKVHDGEGATEIQSGVMRRVAKSNTQEGRSSEAGPRFADDFSIAEKAEKLGFSISPVVIEQGSAPKSAKLDEAHDGYVIRLRREGVDKHGENLTELAPIIAPFKNRLTAELLCAAAKVRLLETGSLVETHDYLEALIEGLMPQRS